MASERVGPRAGDRRRRAGARRGPTIRSRAAIALLLVAGLAPAGCGASSLSAGQLRARASRICAVAQRQTGRIATPTLPSQGLRYLSRGVAALAPAVAQLRALHPSGDLGAGYRQAVRAVRGELAALRGAVKGLRAGNDPVVAIKTLQQQLTPLEAQADGAWSALGIPACASR